MSQTHMMATALIAFREFLEAFLIIGVFFGISKKLQLKKELEISLAAGIGILISLLLATGTYVFGDVARNILTEKRADALESYLLIFSGLFIAYVVFSLHNVMNQGRGMKLLSAHKKLQRDAFDISLFGTIIFLVVREGFEIALLTASVTLFSSFIQNFLGLLTGFTIASCLGISTFFAYVKFPVGKVFRWTEYGIILLGATLVQTGVTKLFETHFNIHLSNMISLHFQFLPDEHSLIGHFLQGIFGVDQGFSVVRLGIMASYLLAIYLLFLRQRHFNHAS